MVMSLLMMSGKRSFIDCLSGDGSHFSTHQLIDVYLTVLKIWLLDSTIKDIFCLVVLFNVQKTTKQKDDDLHCIVIV